MNTESTTPQLIIRRISAEETVPLRHSVLWPDHPVSHPLVRLKEDGDGDHYGAFLDGVVEPVAVISVFDERLPDAEAVVPSHRFRKLACDPAHQGKGIGTKLLQHVFRDVLAKTPSTIIWCDARVSAAGWYERDDIGMARFGETFIKSGVDYVRMKKILTPDLTPQ